MGGAYAEATVFLEPHQRGHGLFAGKTKWAERVSRLAVLGRGEGGSRDKICRSQSQNELEVNGGTQERLVWGGIWCRIGTYFTGRGSGEEATPGTLINEARPLCHTCWSL